MKTVLITGASSGIGMELARIYAKNKNNLILVARREDRLKELKKELENNFKVEVDYKVFDLSEPHSGLNLYKTLKDKHIDILINNAGFGTFGNFLEIDYEKEFKMINLNILTLTNLTRLFLKDMKKRGSGKVINIASTAGFQPVPFMTSYAATKAYVLNFTIALNAELKNSGIQIVALCPGATKSEFQDAAGMGNTSFFRGKLPSAKQVAEYAYSQVTRDKTIIVHGLYNKLLIFIERFISKKLITEIIKKTI